MIEEKFKSVFLGDKYFQFITQKTCWTKAQYRTLNTNNTDDYPLYTAAKEPVAYVPRQSTLPISASVTNPVISFGANGDGSAGTNFVYHVRSFYVSNDRTCIKVNDRQINPLFVYYKLQDIKKIYSFDFHYKATPKNVSLVSLEIPLKFGNQFDLEEQQEVIKSLIKHEKVKNLIADLRDRISSALVALDIAQPYREEHLGNNELFDISIGKRVLKKDVLSSGIPIYSANIHEPFGFMRESILSDFSVPSLLWGIDGIFDWNLISESKPFMPTDHCGVLRVKHPKIFPQYIYYILRATKERYGFDRIYRASLTNIKEVSVRLPSLNDQYDLDIQIEIANKYKKVDHIKKVIVETLSHIIDTSIMW